MKHNLSNEAKVQPRDPAGEEAKPGEVACHGRTHAVVAHGRSIFRQAIRSTSKEGPYLLALDRRVPNRQGVELLP